MSNGKKKALLLSQAAATLAVIAAPWPNGITAIVLLALWTATFWPIARAEAVMFSALCLLFIVNDALAVRGGVLTFTDPSWLGLPAYEFFAWGYWLFLGWRFLGGPAPALSRTAWTAALVFCLCFAFGLPSFWLAVATGAVFLGAVFLWHGPWDLAYAGFFILLGFAVEVAGVWSGEWIYPAEGGRIPIWFVFMWGGIGLFFRRIGLPILFALADRLPPARGSLTIGERREKGCG